MRCVCTEHSSSSSHLERQLSAAFHRIQAAVDARRGGSDEEALEKASSAHTTVSPRSRVPLMRCWSATVAAMDRTRLLPACGGCPQHQCRGCGRLWRPGMSVACGFHEPLLCGPPRLAENRSESAIASANTMFGACFRGVTCCAADGQRPSPLRRVLRGALPPTHRRRTIELPTF